MDLVKLEDVPDEWVITHSPLVVEPALWAKNLTMLAFAELYYAREASAVNVLSPGLIALAGMYRMPTLR